uniref:Pre-mRNA-splicing factor SYF2 n=1 Tax=Fundulus heteroclitus TaxID=8078 RepID=A0A3Q2U5K2_FUNHE
MLFIGFSISADTCSLPKDTAAATAEETTETLASQKREERLRKFRELHFKRVSCVTLPDSVKWRVSCCRAAVYRVFLGSFRKMECAARGEDYNRVKLLEVTADEAERWERKKKKKNPDTGFAGYAEAQFRQYQRLTKQIRPDLQSYEKQREESGEDFYPTSNSLSYGTHVPTKDGIDRMVEDVEKQIEKRAKYSRRRAYNDDADIDYINERNAKFNKKAERFYGKYTAEIKQNLERGTAV